MEPAAFRLVAQCLNHLPHHVPPLQSCKSLKYINDNIYGNSVNCSHMLFYTFPGILTLERMACVNIFSTLFFCELGIRFFFSVILMHFM